MREHLAPTICVCVCVSLSPSVCLLVFHKSPTSLDHPSQSLLAPESVAKSPPSVNIDLTHSKLFCALIIPILSYLSSLLLLLVLHPLACLRPFSWLHPSRARLTMSFIRVSPLSSISVVHAAAALHPWPPAQSQYRPPKKHHLYLCLF